MSMMFNLLEISNYNQLYIHITVIVIFSILGYICIGYAEKIVSNKCSKKELLILLLHVTSRFMKAVVIVIGLSWIIQILVDYFDIKIIDENLILKLRTTTVIVTFGYLLLITTKDITNTLIRISGNGHVKVGMTTIQKIRTILQIIIIAISVLMLLDNFGVNLAGLLAFGGLGGIIIGFAAKDMVSNIFGALVIMMDKPFIIGDRVDIVGMDIEGMVEEINWRITKIMTVKGYPVYIPNMLFLSNVVENYSRMTHRRIKETFKIKCDNSDNLQQVSDSINEMLRNHPGIDSEKKFTVATITSIGEQVCNLLIHAFTHTHQYVEYQKIKQSIFIESAKILKKYGLKIMIHDAAIQINYLGDKED